MKTNINLNETRGTYSNALSKHLQEIYNKYERGIAVNELKQFILDCTKNSSQTTAKLKFEQIINSKRNNNDLIMYISNVVLRAEHLSANINDKWSNEK